MEPIENPPENLEKMTKPVSYTDTRRMKLRGQIVLASEIIAPYWPMRTFVHHNPLHNLEYLPFHRAVTMGRNLLGGSGYLPNDLYREFFRSGRIRPKDLDRALGTFESLARDPETVAIGNLKLSRFDVLRAHVIHGVTAPHQDVIGPQLNLHPDRRLIEALARYLATGDAPDAPREGRDPADPFFPGGPATLSAVYDRTFHTRIADQINVEMVKWCEAFLDEDHATWTMPGREQGFYRAWKALARQEWSPLGIRSSREKVAELPSSPEDALLEHLSLLDIPEILQLDYLSLHLAALPGWAGFIKWRSEQDDYPFQEAYPADLLQYLAVRLWYERETVRDACRSLGIEGTFGALREFLLGRENTPRPPGRNGPGARIDDAWRLVRLADALEVEPDALLETPEADLKTVVGWIDGFPESEHGPVWLDAYEAGYRDDLIANLKAALSASGESGGDGSTVRPQGQAVFCIDVRSESFRRHLERVGDYETFGFAGFFSVFVKYRELGGSQETDQFPVIMKAKNAVREVLRSYHGDLLSRHETGSKLLNAGHELLHDLKENVVTPYVAVESLGWFYSLPLVGKTVFPEGFRRWIARLRSLFVPHIATALTVDKLSRDEVTEMLVAEQRSDIRRALQDGFGDRELNLSLERLEFLRKRALGEIGDDRARTMRRNAALTQEEEDLFVGELRDRHRITHGWSFARMERITQIGFTLEEQIFTVETALRMMGFTKNFARLVLFCGHGSTSDNNPFESALDCGACGGNSGKPNARILATMANKPQVREQLSKNGIAIPPDTFFIAGEHDTATDEVRLFDLEDLPHTHNKDLIRITADLKKTGSRNTRERCSRFPEIEEPVTRTRAAREALRRSADWSQNRPEWGLSGNASFIIGRRDLIRRADLEGRAFLHSYDYREDANGRLLEIILTGPQVVGEWINMEHYFSTVDNEVYGAGSKIYHNVVGRFGIMSGPQSDLRTGLAWQTVMSGERPYHEPMRLLTVIEAPLDRITQIIGRHNVLEHFYDNAWVRLMALNPEDKRFHSYVPHQGWVPYSPDDVHTTHS